MKKLLTILLTLAIALSMTSVVAFAEEKVPTIYINNASSTTEYRVYKLFDLAAYAEDGSSYSYTIDSTSPWYAFFTSDDIKGYFTFEQLDQSTTYYIKAADSYTEDKASGVAQKALDFAKANDIDPVATSKEPAKFTLTGGVGTFTLTDFGYYLVDSSVGALCGLTTTKHEGHITVKNSVPTIDKNVEEDSIVGSGTNAFGDSNTADIGQQINFDVTVFAQAGAENYIYHDTMENMELLRKPDNSPMLEVYYNNDPTPRVKGTDYVIHEDCTDGCTFGVAFTEAFCKTLKANDKVYIKYSAKLKHSANIGATTGNKNTGWLTYGDIGFEAVNRTTDSITTTYTFGFDIVKTDANYNKLAGAKFKLYREDGTPVPLAYNATNETYRIYNVLVPGEEEAVSEITVVENSHKSGFTVASIIGLDNGTYYLEETVAPQGYNKMSGHKTFTISNGSIEATFANGTYDRGSGVHIENKAGATMPETGGTGTMMFVAIGTLLALGAGVLLVTKKRMSMIED